MLKLASFLLVLLNWGYVAGTTCPVNFISPADPPGNFPLGSNNITTIDKGTNCTVKFTIPVGQVLLVKMSADFQSPDDSVTIFDQKGKPKYVLLHTTTPFYDVPFWLPSDQAGVQIVSVSGKTRFMMSYSFQMLANFKQGAVRKTGEHFQASSITGNTFTTITASSATEKVIVSYAQGAGDPVDPFLEEYFVYDGDNLNTAPFLGTLDALSSKLKISSTRSISIVNFYGSKSNAYILGNDASTVQIYNTYTVILTNKNHLINGTQTDYTATNGAAITFICLDCTNFYWDSMSFDGAYVNSAHVTFQGQTPTHKREKLIRYDPMTFLSSQLPQLIPSNVFTMNFYMTRLLFLVHTKVDDFTWKTPYDGRKGYIFSPNLWTPSANNFTYEFRDNSRLFNFTINMNKMSFPMSSDQMTLKIGTGTSGNPSVNNLYPRDQSSSGKVMANGNYMQVGLAASTGADVRLSFEMQKVSSASAVGLMVSIVMALFYTI